MRALIVGCGYIGLALGRQLTRLGHQVFGVRRDPRGEEFGVAGIELLFADISRPADIARLPTGFDWVINCVSATVAAADRKSEIEDLKSYKSAYVEGTQNLLSWLSETPPSKFVYTSSTSVYGQTDGSTVDENSPTKPASETAKILVSAEKLLLEARQEHGFPAVILRLAGIYGPGRGYWFKQFLSGQAVIESRGDRILNMIHRDDVVGAIIAALECADMFALWNGATCRADQSGDMSPHSKAPSPPIYNVVDNEPVTQAEFFQWLSARLGRPLPPHVPQDATLDRKRGLTNKRVSNRKLRQELSYALKFPTFREGYEDLILNHR